ncbi:MAG: type secretion system family protein [Francisellaceae bacterium]|nr:type secretion system family protein [Francisellaceae bacterium]
MAEQNVDGSQKSTPKKSKIKGDIFQYEYKDIKGNLVKGEIKSSSLNVAKLQLKQRNINFISITKKDIPKTAPRSKKKIKQMDIALFTRQMSTMSGAGIPLVQSFGVIIDSSDHEGIKTLVSDIKADVESGSSFTQALRKHPNEFDYLFCSLIEAGEQSGKLDTMLLRIAVYKEKTESLKRKIKKAMYYPIAVISVAILVSVLLLVKVVPTFKELFKGFGADLPAFTLFVLGISDALRAHFLSFLAIIIASLYGLKVFYKKSVKFRNYIQRMNLKLPIFGSILKKTYIARFARTLSTTFAAGVPLPDALESIGGAMGNVVYTTAVAEIKEGVTTGQQMKQAMRKTGVFPSLVVQMVGIGEESGTLEDMLSKVAGIYEEEIDASVDGLATLLEPLIMVILGVIVGGLVIAMYLPIFKMGSVI